MSRKTVSNWAKKNFIYWFTEKYELAAEAMELLEEILENEDYLSRMHITEDGTLLKPLLVISTPTKGMPLLLLQTFDKNLRSPEEIRSYLAHLEDKPFYMTLYFPDRSTCKPYAAVSVNPPLLFEPEKAKALRFDFELSLWLDEYRKNQRRQEILAEIDSVLERGEKRRFYQLVRELKRI